MGATKARGLATLLLGMIIGAIAAGVSFGQSNEGEARIGVLRLTDGGNQVALQLREADGGWGEPLVPDLGVQAADAEPGKWLYSSAIAVQRRAEPMRLGMLSIRSGPFAELGRLTEHGAELAVRHVNAAGGVWGLPVELVIEDTGHDAAAAAAHARRLATKEGVHAIVGPLTSSGLQSVGESVAPELGMPVVSPSASSPAITFLDDDDYAFRTIISDSVQAEVLARLAMEEGYDKVAVVYRDDLWGRHLHAHFIAAYEGEATSAALAPDRESYADEVAEAAAGGAPVLVFITAPRDTIAVLRSAVPSGAFETYLFEHSNRRIDVYEAFPEALENAEGIAYVGRHVTEAEGRWEADYQAAFGAEEPLSPWARETYDAAISLMLAAEHAGSADGTRIRNSLRAVGGPPGVRFPASSSGVAGALAAIRAGREIDLDGEATALDWGPNGDVLAGHMEYWRFRDGEIATVREFELRFEPEAAPPE